MLFHWPREISGISNRNFWSKKERVSSHRIVLTAFPPKKSVRVVGSHQLGDLFMLQMLNVPFNPFIWDRTRERVSSNVLALDLKDDKRLIIEMSELPSDVIIEVPLKAQANVLEVPHLFIKSKNPRFHEINVDYENTAVQLDITLHDATVNLVIYMALGHRPTNEEHDFNGTISSNWRCIWTGMNGNVQGRSGCSSNVESPIEILAKNPGKYYLGLQIQESDKTLQKRQKRSCFGHRRQKRSCVETKSPSPTPPKSENTSVEPAYDPSTDQNYTLKVTMRSCVYLSDKRGMWITDGCKVSQHKLHYDQYSKLKCRKSILFILGGGYRNNHSNIPTIYMDQTI